MRVTSCCFNTVPGRSIAASVSGSWLMPSCSVVRLLPVPTIVSRMNIVTALSNQTARLV